MHRNYERLFLLFLIAIGAALRIVDITIPDLATDEAQFALGASAAQPPVGMFLFEIAQMLFGHEIFAVRGVSVLLGLLTLPLIFGITKTFSDEKTALLATAIAAIFPSHIFFSRLAYLSVALCFGWALLLFVFLKARKACVTPSSAASAARIEGRTATLWIIAVFLASVFVTHIKTQGLLLPFFLMIGNFIETGITRKKNSSLFTLHFSLTTTLFLSLIPISLYILTHPGIAATLFLYGGSMYGVSDFMMRVQELCSVWWSLIGIFLIAAIFGMSALRKCPWPLQTLIVIGLLIGLLLGPGHSYYATKLVFLSIPLAIALTTLAMNVRMSVMTVLLLCTLFTLGPAHLVPFPDELFLNKGSWNEEAATLNELLKGEKSVIVFGDAGHQVRWYLEPEVLVGKNLSPPYDANYALLLNIGETRKVPTTKVVFVGETGGLVQMKD